MKHSFVAAALIALVSTTSAWAHSEHRGRGHHGHHHDHRHDHHHDHRHDTCSDRGDCDGADLVFMSTSLAISLSTQGAEDKKLQIHLQAAEDAAVYLESGRMTGTLAALVALSREKAAQLSGAEAGARLSEQELVDGLLAAAEKALDRG
jgi:hypothetical protein